MSLWAQGLEKIPKSSCTVYIILLTWLKNLWILNLKSRDPLGSWKPPFEEIHLVKMLKNGPKGGFHELYLDLIAALSPFSCL